MRALERRLAPHGFAAEQAHVRAVVVLHLHLDPGIHHCLLGHACVKTRDRSALLSDDGAEIVLAVLASLFRAPCYVSTCDPAGAQTGSPRRFCTEHDEDPLRGVSAPGALAEPFASLWLEGGLLLHLGGLVPGCCTSGTRTESVSAGADGCTDSKSLESELGGGKRAAKE